MVSARSFAAVLSAEVSTWIPTWPPHEGVLGPLPGGLCEGGVVGPGDAVGDPVGAPGVGETTLGTNRGRVVNRDQPCADPAQRDRGDSHVGGELPLGQAPGQVVRYADGGTADLATSLLPG